MPNITSGEKLKHPVNIIADVLIAMTLIFLRALPYLLIAALWLIAIVAFAMAGAARGGADCGCNDNRWY